MYLCCVRSLLLRCLRDCTILLEDGRMNFSSMSHRLRWTQMRSEKCLLRTVCVMYATGEMMRYRQAWQVARTPAGKTDG